jgi:hypothetical protein
MRRIIVLLCLERFRAKWIPVRLKKTRQNKNLEPRSDSIGSERLTSRLCSADLWQLSLLDGGAESLGRIKGSLARCDRPSLRDVFRDWPSEGVLAIDNICCSPPDRDGCAMRARRALELDLRQAVVRSGGSDKAAQRTVRSTGGWSV